MPPSTRASDYLDHAGHRRWARSWREDGNSCSLWGRWGQIRQKTYQKQQQIGMSDAPNKNPGRRSPIFEADSLGLILRRKSGHPGTRGSCGSGFCDACYKLLRLKEQSLSTIFFKSFGIILDMINKLTPAATHMSYLRQCLLGYLERSYGRFQSTQDLMLVHCCVHALMEVARHANCAALSLIQVFLQ